MTKVLVIHGPNLNMLGIREKSIYGKVTLKTINTNLKNIAMKKKIKLKIVQSNEEGKLVDAIQQANKKYDYIIINPGAFTHTSIAIRDAIAAINAKVIEVHLSNIYARETFRKESFIAPVAIGQISGFGENSYYLALEYILKCHKE